jgi:hypothetical protein
LLLIGEHFHYVQFQDEFSSRIRDLRIKVLPGGRFGMAWEKAGEIGPLVTQFIG